MWTSDPLHPTDRPLIHEANRSANDVRNYIAVAQTIYNTERINHGRDDRHFTHAFVDAKFTFIAWRLTCFECFCSCAFIANERVSNE